MAGFPGLPAPGGGNRHPVLRVFNPELEHPRHLRPQGGQCNAGSADTQVGSELHLFIPGVGVKT